MKQLKLAFVLTALMSMVGLQAFADWDYSTTVQIDHLYYYLDKDNQQAQVTSMADGKYAGDIVISSSITHEAKTYSVTSIGFGAFRGCSGLTSVTIPHSVISIDAYAFESCSGLTSVTIPNSVTSIGSGAFEGCSDLTSITIPNSVTFIDRWTFSDTSWYNDQPDGVVYAGLNVYKYKGTMPINTSITIKHGTVSISPQAFDNCSGLTSITIPNSVTSIGWWAFEGCTGLTSIAIPNSVTSIGNVAFKNCSSLTSVTIPNSVTSIGNSTFNGCSGLNSMKVESGNTKYDSRDNCNAIIETASNTLVSGCKNTVIPNSVTSIDYYAFCDCSGLTFITIPNSVTSIGFGAFEGCTGLTSVTIPNSVTSIGDYAFSDCYGLESLTIGSGVTSYGNSAFQYCTKLTSVTVLNSTPVAISQNVFTSRKKATLYIPKGSKDAYEAANIWKEFKEIIEIDITGIDQIMSNGKNNATIFTLDGKRINKPQKGINIIGGKKVVVK
ncbi:MAG: leucine-rich repeat domain-containing protein [Prevotella sp.]|nr:leucine-rich repeat domain-containing protein [Prevotella sp.]